MDRRTRRTRHERDPARKRRQRTLAERIEQPLRFQPLLQLPEGKLKRPDSLRLHLRYDKLVRAAGRIDVEVGVTNDLLAFLQSKPHAAGNASPDHGANLRVLVLEGEIDVSRLGPRHSRNFPADP